MMEIVPYSEAVEESQAALAQRMWPTKRRRRDPRYLRWKFRGPARGEVPGLLVAVLDGRVVGQLGLIPAKLRVDGRELDCQWACDLMVDPDVRRQGVASRLFDSALGRGMVTLGSNPSPAAEATMLRIGFCSAVGPWQTLLPVRLDEVLTWKLPPPLRRLSPVLARVGQPVLRAHQRRLASASDGGVRQVHWPDAVPLVEHGQAESAAQPHIVHDEDFLTWRCEGLTGFAPEMSGLRVDDSYALFEAAASRTFAYDWRAASAEETRVLMGRLLREARAAGSSIVQAYAQNDTERDWLRQSGFLVQRTRVSVLYHPAEALGSWTTFRYSIFDSDGNL